MVVYLTSHKLLLQARPLLLPFMFFLSFIFFHGHVHAYSLWFERGLLSLGAMEICTAKHGAGSFPSRGSNARCMHVPSSHPKLVSAVTRWTPAWTVLSSDWSAQPEIWCREPTDSCCRITDWFARLVMRWHEYCVMIKKKKLKFILMLSCCNMPYVSAIRGCI